MFPETVLHTKRLTLRPFNCRDIADTQATPATGETARASPSL
ncbi:hypothetical protein ACQEV9_45415 [Streptomyces chartreusis]